MLILLAGVCLVMSSQTNTFVDMVVAQEPTTEPTPLPTPTSIATWPPTSPPAHATATSTQSGPAPSTPTATLTSRFIEFRVSKETIETGECVLFQWVVRGDVALVEFENLGSDENPLLVSEEDERTECPEEDTQYRLIVSWLDGTVTWSDVIEIKIGSGGGNGNGNGGGTSVPPPGTFVPVTPVSMPGVIVVTPVGALDGVIYLPETGEMPPLVGTAIPASNVVRHRSSTDNRSSETLPAQAEQRAAVSWLRWQPWLVFIVGIGLLLRQKIIV